MALWSMMVTFHKWDEGLKFGRGVEFTTPVTNKDIDILSRKAFSITRLILKKGFSKETNNE